MYSSLTSSDYEKLLKFHLFINSDYDRFISNVLYYISENFEFPLSVYTVFNKNSKGEIYVQEIYSKSFHAESLQNYKNLHYKSDLFYQRASYKKASTSGKYIYTIEDVATHEDFFSTVYGQSLRNQNICNQVIVRGALRKAEPFHILSFFKTDSEGDFKFTGYETELLNNIGRIFSESVELYKKHVEHKSLGFYLDSFCGDQNIGLAVIDEQFKITYYSQWFHKFIFEICDIAEHNNIAAAITEVIENAEKRYDILIKKLTDSFSFQEGKYSICFKPHNYFNGELVKRLLFITIKGPHKLKSSEINLEILKQYNFSPRETEIIELMAKGYDNKKIAGDLYISISTAKFHIRNILNKLGVTNRASAIAKILKPHA